MALPVDAELEFLGIMDHAFLSGVQSELQLYDQVA